MVSFDKDGKGFKLESAEEVAAFQELVDFGKAWQDKQHQRAQVVFDIFCDDKFPDGVDPDNPMHDEVVGSSIGRWRIDINNAIRANLDHRTIGAFVKLVVDHSSRAKQSILAHKRHAENHAMKAEVFAWLDEHGGEFKSMDKAAEKVSRTVSPIAFRTARTWVGQWKKLRSAGTP